MCYLFCCLLFLMRFFFHSCFVVVFLCFHVFVVVRRFLCFESCSCVCALFVCFVVGVVLCGLLICFSVCASLFIVDSVFISMFKCFCCYWFVLFFVLSVFGGWGLRLFFCFVFVMFLCVLKICVLNVLGLFILFLYSCLCISCVVFVFQFLWTKTRLCAFDVCVFCSFFVVV